MNAKSSATILQKDRLALALSTQVKMVYFDACPGALKCKCTSVQLGAFGTFLMLWCESTVRLDTFEINRLKLKMWILWILISYPDALKKQTQ